MSPELTGRVLSTAPPEKSDKLIFKFREKGQRILIVRAILKKENKVGGLVTT